MINDPDRHGRAPASRARRWLPFGAGGLGGAIVVAVALVNTGIFSPGAVHPPAAPSGVAAAIPAQIATSTAVPGAAGAPSPAAGVAPKMDIRAAMRAVEPGVVNITDYAVAPSGSGPTATGEGTGMVLDTQGDVLTNAHVVAGGTSYSVQPAGQSTVYQAKVLAVDTIDDVAVIQIQNPGKLSPVPLGHSAGIQVGDPVVAIGNALGLAPGGPTVTQGIISALNRTLTTDNGTQAGTEHLTGLIQTDTPINPGNSGGPLINASNEVIGMNTAVSTDGQNIGFTIPIDRITPLLDEMKKGTVPPSSSAFLGVAVGTPVAGGPGAQITKVSAGSAADAAGLRVGDIIVAVEGQPVVAPTDLEGYISQYAPGTKVTIRYTRGGTPQTTTATLGSRTSSS